MALEWFRSFFDLLRNPGRWKSAVHDREAEMAQVAAWSDRQVEAGLRAFVLENKYSMPGWGHDDFLEALGERAWEPALRLLRSEPQALSTESSKGTISHPIGRLCDILEKMPPEQVVPELLPLMASPDNKVRAQVALILGASGLMQSLPGLETALADSEESVRSFAMIGLNRALRRDALPDVLRHHLCGPLQQVIRGRFHWTTKKSADLLLQFDRDLAIDFLLSPELFHIENKLLHEIFAALAKHDVLIARDRLYGLIAELEAGELKYPRADILGEALNLLGKHSVPEDRSFLEARLDHPNPDVADGAAVGFRTNAGFGHVFQGLWKRHADSPGSLTIGERYLVATMLLDIEVRNGGFGQYFYNSAGDDFAEALRGFEEFNVPEAAAIVREAGARFGPDGPCPNRSLRQEQLSLMIDEDGSGSEDFESRYYTMKTNVTVQVARYMVSHPEAFPPRESPR